MRFHAAVACLAVGLALVPARADAITVREVIELHRAGVGEEVLLALIEIDQRVFPTDPATIRTLKDAGVGEKVIVAIVKSGRTPVVPVVTEAEPAPVVSEPPQPQVVVVERERPVVREVAVPVPVYVAVPVRRSPRSIHDDRDDRDDRPRKPAEPVYWGWGGKLRPDAWQPAPTDVRRDPKRDR
jgi:hypothetical protein